MKSRAVPLAGLLLALGAGTAAADGQQPGPPPVVGQQFGVGETAATSSQPVPTLVDPSRAVTIDTDSPGVKPQAGNRDGDANRNRPQATNRAEGENESAPRTGPDYESAYEPQDYLTPKPPPGWNRPEAEDTDGDTRTYERGEMGVGRQYGEPAGNALADPAGRTTVPVDRE